jgi:hypothetical protein
LERVARSFPRAAETLLEDAPEEQLVSGIRIVATGASLLAPAVTR